jgi:hypothetical protein
LYGAGQLTANLNDSGSKGDMLSLVSNNTAAGTGGAILFGNTQSEAAGSLGFAAIKGMLSNGNGNTKGDIAFSLRNNTSDTNLTEAMRITSAGSNFGAIGIGTSSPNAVVDIYNSNDSTLRLDRTSGGVEYMQLAAARGGQTGVNNQYLFDVVGSSFNTTRSLNFRFSAASGGSFDTALSLNPFTNITMAYPFVESSTTATSTISTGGLTVGTSQFVVQQNSGFVGIGTVNPAANLDAQGTQIFHGDVTSSHPGIVFNEAAPNASEILSRQSTTNTSKVNFGTVGSGTYLVPQTTDFGIGTASGSMGIFLGTSNTPFLTWDTSGNVLFNGASTTLQNFTASNSTSTNATTTGAFSVGTSLSALANGQTLSLGSGTNSSTYASFANGRAYLGYDGANALIQGGLTKGIDFAVNTATASSGGAGVVATLTSGGTFGLGTTTPLSNLSIVGAAGGRLPTSGTTPTNSLVSLKGSANNALYMGIDNGTPFDAWLQAADVTGLNNFYPIAINPNGGNVGIGTSTPAAALDIHSNSTALSIERQGVGEYFFNVAGGAVGSDTGDLQVIPQYANGGYLFKTSNSSNINSNALAIDKNGNIGVGTTGPNFPLDVSRANGNGATSLQVSADSTSGASNGVAGYNYRIDSTNLWQTLTDNNAGGTSQNAFFVQYNGSTANRFLTVQTNGNVGIGTTTPSSKLTVNADSTTGTQLLINGASNPAQQLLIGYSTSGDYGSIQAVKQGSALEPLALNSAGGNVGIGTTSPQGPLQVSYASNAPIIFGDLNPSDATGGLYVQGANDGSSGGLVDISRGNIAFNPLNSTNFVKLQEALNSSVSYIGLGGTDDFQVITGITNAGSSNTSGTPRLTVKNGGNVGIGTVSPDAKLTVATAAIPTGVDGANTATFYTSADSFADVLIARGGVANPQELGLGINNASHYSELQATQGGVGVNTLVLNRQGGNVGIATTTPAAKLDVYNVGGAGGIMLTGNDPSNAYIGVENTLSVNSRAFRLVAGVTGAIEDSFSIYDASAAATRLVIDDSGNVGIGRNAPGAKLDINGGIAVSTGSGLEGYVSGAGTFTSGISGFYPIATGPVGLNDTIVKYATGSNGFALQHGSTNVLVADGNGNVVVGASSVFSATTKLTVSNGNEVITQAGGTASSLDLDQNGVVGWTLKNNATTGTFTIDNGAATAFAITTGGTGGTNPLVGIGTAAPFEQLTVSGSMATSSVVSTGNAPNSVFVQGRYTYVINNGAGTLQIFDTSDPTAPVVISSTSVGADPFAVYVAGRYAYVVTNFGTAVGTFQIYDVSNPAAPIRVSSTSTDGLTSVYVQGRYAYVTDFGNNLLDVYDISNPSSPTFTGSVVTGANPRNLYVQGRYVYVVNQTDANLQAFDVSNPALPVLVSTVSTGGAPFDVYVQGRYAYVANFSSNSLQIFDVSNPTSIPSAVGSVTSSSAPFYLYVQGRYAYVANNTGSNIQVFDVSKPTAPVSVNSISTFSGSASGLRSIYVQGRYAYAVANNNSKLEIFDLGGGYIQQLETGGLETGSLSVRNNIQGLDESLAGGLTVGNNLNVGGSFALTASTFNATSTAAQNYSIFSIGTASSTSIMTALYNGNVGIGTTSPFEQFTVAGKVPTGAISDVTTLAAGTDLNPTSIFVQGRYAYVTDTTPAGALVAFDISNPAAPAQIGFAANLLGNASDTVFIQGRYAYVADPGPTRTKIYDISNNNHQFNTAALLPDTNGGSQNMTYVQGRYLYTNDGANFEIADISSPGAPVIISDTLTSPGTPVAVYVVGHIAYVLNQSSNTFQSIDVSNPANPISLVNVAMSFKPYSLFVQGRYAYVAGTNNVAVFDISNPFLPVLAGSIATASGNNNSIFVQGRYAYVVNGSANTLQILDVSSPSPISVGTVPTDSNPVGVFVQGRYAYVVNNTSSTLQVFDIGGGYIQQLETGGLETGTLSVNNNIQALGDETLGGGLSVANGINAFGSFSVSGDSFNATSTAGQKYPVFTVATASSSPIITALYNGKVGIGTSTPGATLDVIGSLCVDDTTPTCANATRNNGTIYSVAALSASLDLAESYPTKDATLSPGEIVTLDANNPDYISRASQGETTPLIGIISTKPGFWLGGFNDAMYQNDVKLPVALSGHVPLKVNNEGGSIAVGDKLALSSVPGVGKKAGPGDPTVGIALEPMTATSGTIEVFVNLKDAQSSQDADVSAIISAIGFNPANASAGLNIGSDVTIRGALHVDQIGSIGTILSLESDVNFIGRPYFNSDTGGLAIVEQGARQVNVVFDKPYVGAPVVNATLSLDASSTQDQIDNILTASVGYAVVNRSQNGFSILLSRAAPENMTFSWIALAIQNMKIADSSAIAQPNPPSTVIDDTVPPPTNDQGDGTTTPPTSGDASSTPPTDDGSASSTPPTIDSGGDNTGSTTPPIVDSGAGDTGSTTPSTP